MSTTDRPLHVPFWRRLTAAAGAGVALVVPFVLLERQAGGGFPMGAPIALYGTMWLLGAAGCLLAWSATRGRGPGAGGGRSASRRGAALRGVALLGALLVAVLWLSLVRDQWPCFLGLPNCD